MGHFGDENCPTLYPPCGNLKKKNVGEKKYCHNGPYNIGNPIKYLLNSNVTEKGEWQTLSALAEKKKTAYENIAKSAQL